MSPHQANSIDLCSLDEVKNFLFRGGGNQTNVDDDLLQRLITAVSEFMRQEASRAFEMGNHTEMRSGVGYGQKRLYLKQWPVTAVASLYINGQLIAAKSSNAANYYTNGYAFTDDHISLTGYEFSEGSDNIQVSYTAGYNVTPPDLVQSCVVTVGRKYREIDRLGHQSKSLAGETVSFDLSDLDDFAQRTINRYRRVIPI